MRYFSFDAETDGLYGEVFAIAAVVMNESRSIEEQFCLKCISPGVKDPWTWKNCLPFLAEIPDCESRSVLRERFWSFYMRHRDRCVIVADTPCPVEAGLLRACVETDLSTRAFQGPYPLIDVASVLFAHGVDPDIDRMEYCGMKGKRHHPMDDAVASVLSLIKVMGRG